MAFATLDDLALRLPGTATTGDGLTAKQQAQGELLLDLATGLVTDAVGKDADWADALDPVPAVLRAVTLEAVARVMQNPAGVRSESKQLGQYQHSASFTDDAHTLALTDREARLCRQAVHGRLTGSARVGSIADRLRSSTGWEPAMGTLVVDPTLDDETEDVA